MSVRPPLARQYGFGSAQVLLRPVACVHPERLWSFREGWRVAGG